jgi:hypothetical protein
LTIRVEHIGESDDTGGVGLFGEVAHTLQFRDFTKDFTSAVLLLDE